MLDYAYILIKVILTREIEGEEEGLGKREIDKGKGCYWKKRRQEIQNTESADIMGIGF